LIKFYEAILHTIDNSQTVQTELFNIVQEVKDLDPNLYQQIKHHLSKIKTYTDTCKQTADKMIENVANCKVGVTIEDFATWNSRAQTFCLVPKSYRAECINIEKSKDNADCIEKLVFSILSNIGLKIPTTKVKSNQSEFFKVYVYLKDDNHLSSVMPIIKKGVVFK
jgi:hypothetical protein